MKRMASTRTRDAGADKTEVPSYKVRHMLEGWWGSKVPQGNSGIFLEMGCAYDQHDEGKNRTGETH